MAWRLEALHAGPRTHSFDIVRDSQHIDLLFCNSARLQGKIHTVAMPYLDMA